MQIEQNLDRVCVCNQYIYPTRLDKCGVSLRKSRLSRRCRGSHLAWARSGRTATATELHNGLTQVPGRIKPLIVPPGLGGNFTSPHSSWGVGSSFRKFEVEKRLKRKLGRAQRIELVTSKPPQIQQIARLYKFQGQHALRG